MFTSQLERSRESTDVANMRAAYAAGQTAALTGWVGQTELTSAQRTSSNWYYDPGVDGSLSSTKPANLKMGQGTATDGKFDKSALPSICAYETNTDYKGKVIKVTITNGVVSAVAFE